MEFDKKTLTVKAGSKVKLILTNTASAAVMRHNWVLTKPGKDQEIGLKGTTKGEASGFIEPSPDILAFTAVSKPGNSVEVVFDAPPVGKYPYICSVSGHYMMMKGNLIVE